MQAGCLSSVTTGFLIAAEASDNGLDLSKDSNNSAQWSLAAELPISTQELYPAVHQGRLYVAGGIAAKLGVPYFTDTCISYNPDDNSWRDEANLPENMHHAALVSTAESSTGSGLFLVGGFHGAYSSVWQMRNAVYELGDSGWESRTSLPKPQAEGVVATAEDGTIHIVSGQSPKGGANSSRSDHSEVTTHLRWQAGDEEWTAAAPIPTPRNSATGGWVKNQLIVTGGRTASGNLSHTEIYDGQEDRWRSAAPLPLPQAGTASVVVDEGIIVFGGEIFTPRSDVFANVWRYDINKDSWQELPKMPNPRHGIGAGRFENKIYVVGGALKPGGSGTSNLNEVLTL